MAFGSMNGSHDGEMADINVTPLVDVMLVLMIVFMIAMPAFTSSIKVRLPTSNSLEHNDRSHVVNITIKPDGTYFVGDTPIAADALKSELEQIKSKDKETVVAIRADQEAHYEYVAKVLELARQVGLGKIGFVTDATPHPNNVKQ